VIKAGSDSFVVGDLLMSDEITDSIATNAQGPAKAAGNAGSSEQHKLTEQIEADRYRAAKDVAKRNDRGLRFSKLVPPGAE
jgi:hypothetical protein